MAGIEPILDAIYESALETGEWASTVVGLADFCGVDNAALVAIDPRIDLAMVNSPRADPAVIRQYHETWWALDPTAAATARVAPGIVTDLGTTGRQRFYRSTFFGEYWSRSGLGAERIASNLYVDNGAFSSVVLQPGAHRDEITADTRARFEALLPHLIRALRASRRLHGLAMALGRARTGDRHAFMSVDTTGRVYGMNEAAEALVREGRGVTVRHGRIGFADEPVREAVMHSIAACLGGRLPPGEGPPIGFMCPRSGNRVTVEVLPLRGPVWPHLPGLPMAGGGLALLVFRDAAGEQAERIAALRERYGLTAAEAHLALEVAKGDGRAAAARRCGITVNTARSHLSRVFDKTGVSRQAELSNLIAGLDDRHD